VTGPEGAVEVAGPGGTGSPGEEPGGEYRSIWTALRQVAFRQAWVDAGGVPTRYAEAGSPELPALVMLHGTGGHWETFADNLGPLSAHFRCVAIDMVGNGFSGKPDVDYEIPVYVDHVVSVMDALGIARASMIGVSLGSWVAARLALDHPERVHKLIFLSTAGMVATQQNMARIRAERTRAVDDPSWASIKAMFEHLLADERSRIPDLVALRQAIYRLPEMKQAIEHVLVLQDPDTRERNLLRDEQWASIAAPALVVASGKNHDEYESTSRRVAALMPRAELLEMPHVQHWPHFEDPATFNEASLRFLLG
jgi:2-hydroxy-6-oxonona-2,4-dienedioate hydrolase